MGNLIPLYPVTSFYQGKRTTASVAVTSPGSQQTTVDKNSSFLVLSCSLAVSLADSLEHQDCKKYHRYFTCPCGRKKTQQTKRHGHPPTVPERETHGWGLGVKQPRAARNVELSKACTRAALAQASHCHPPKRAPNT